MSRLTASLVHLSKALLLLFVLSVIWFGPGYGGSLQADTLATPETGSSGTEVHTSAGDDYVGSLGPYGTCTGESVTFSGPFHWAVHATRFEDGTYEIETVTSWQLSGIGSVSGGTYLFEGELLNRYRTESLPASMTYVGTAVIQGPGHTSLGHITWLYQTDVDGSSTVDSPDGVYISCPS